MLVLVPDRAGQAVSGTITAGGDIASVSAGTPQTFYFDDNTGYWTEVPAIAGAISGMVNTSGSIDRLNTVGDLSGSVTAGLDIGPASIGGDLSGVLSAGQDVSSVSTGTPDQGYFDQATQQNVDVPAILGGVSGSIDAGRDVDAVTTMAIVLAAGKSVSDLRDAVADQVARPERMC